MKQKGLLEGKVSRVYIRYLIPTIIALASQSLYCLADVYFIARGSGSVGLAALNIAMPIFTFYSAFGLLMGIGGATTISILEGQNKLRQKHAAFTLALLFTIVVTLLMTIVGLLFMEEIALFLGATAELLPYVVDYMTPIHLLSVFAVLSYALQVLIRGDHAPNLVMAAMLISNFTNIVLDYVFVVLLDGAMQGAAIATGIAPIIAVFLLSTHFFKKDCSLRFTKHGFSFSLLGRIFANGMASALMEISVSVVVVVMNYVILRVGDALYLAAYAIITNIAYVAKGIINGFAQAAQPLFSTNFGAGHYKRVRHSFYVAFGITCMSGIGAYLMMAVFPNAVVSLFASGDHSLSEIAARGVRLYFLCLPFLCANTVMMYYFQSIELAYRSMGLSLLRGFVLVLLYLALLSTAYQMNGVWLSVSAAEGTSFLLGGGMVITYMRKESKERLDVTDLGHGIVK